MQVNPALPPGVNPPASSTREALLCDVVQLLAPSPQARIAHEQASERREEKLRRRESVQQEVAAQAAAAPRPSEQSYKAERDLAPGSQAARDQQLHERAQEQVSQKPGGFRQALAQAAGRGTPARPATSPACPHDPTPTADAPAEAASTDGNPARSTGSTAPATPTPAARSGALPLASVAAGHARPSTAGPTVTPGPTHVVNAAANSPASVRVLAAPGSTRVGTVSRPSPLTSPVAAPAARTGPANAKSAPQQPALAESEPRTADANLERILRFIQTRIGKESSSATLRLAPPELGMIRLHMELRDQQLSLEVQTHTDAARQLLTDQVETLRRSLEATGIHLERVDIRAPASPDASNSNSSPHTGPWTGPEGSSARHEGGSAGGGSTEPSGTDAEPPDQPAFWEPVAESLVNVLA